MAREPIVITIVDNPDGSVAVTCVPDVKSLINLLNHDAGLTSGQAYALYALRMLSNAAKTQRVASRGLILPPGLTS